MSALKTFVSVGIQEIELENDVIEIAGLKCETYLNSTNLDTFVLGDDFSKSILPLVAPTDRIRFVIKETSSDAIVGCISFSTELFLAYNGQVVAKWITLFDSPDDDEYDGDFTEDDEEAPRALFHLVIDTAENIKQLEETLLSCASFQSPQKTMLEKSFATTKKETQLLQEELTASPKNEKKLDNEDRENVLGFSCQEISQRQEPELQKAPEVIPQFPRKESFISPRMSMQNLHTEQKTKEGDIEIEYSNSERAHTHEIVLDTDLLQFDADLLPEAPTALHCEQHLQKEDLKGLSGSGDECEHEKVDTTACGSHNTLQTDSQPVGASQNQLQVEDNHQTETKIEEISSIPLNTEVEKRAAAQRDTPKTKSNQNKEPELRQTRLELEKMSEMLKESQRLGEALKAKNIEYEQMMKKLQNQLIETCGSYKIANEEKLALKSRVKELEATNELKNKELHELSQNLAKTQTKQIDFEKINIEKQNLRIQNLENIIKDLREQLQQAQSINEVLQCSNKNISDAQTELISRLKKINEESGQEQQKQAARTADMLKNIQELEQRVLQKEKLIEEQDNKMRLHLQKIKGLEEEIELLRRQLNDEQRIGGFVQSEGNSKGSEAVELELAGLKKEFAGLDEKNTQLGLEVQKLRNEKTEMELEFKQIKSRNYEIEIQNLRKNLEMSEIARGKLQDELLNAHKQWQLIPAEQSGKPSSQTQGNYFEEFERERKANKELLKKLQEKEAELEKAADQTRELAIKVKQAELQLAQKDQAEIEIQRLKAEALELSEALDQAREKYFHASEELIKQQACNSEQRDTIKTLNKKIHSLEISLKNAMEDVHRLEARLESSGTTKAHYQTEESSYYSNSNSSGYSSNPPLQMSSKPKSARDEVQRKINEFMKTCNLPVKFVSLGDETYSFGTRKVHVKLLNGNLVVKIGGGYMFIEQFVKMYGAAESEKMAQMRDYESRKQSESENSSRGEDDHKRYSKEAFAKRASFGFDPDHKSKDTEEEDCDSADDGQMTRIAKSSPQVKKAISQAHDTKEVKKNQEKAPTHNQEKASCRDSSSRNNEYQSAYRSSATAETENDDIVGGKVQEKKRVKRDAIARKSCDLSQDSYAKQNSLSKSKVAAQVGATKDISPFRKSGQLPGKKVKEANSSYMKC